MRANSGQRGLYGRKSNKWKIKHKKTKTERKRSDANSNPVGREQTVNEKGEKQQHKLEKIKMN